MRRLIFFLIACICVASGRSEDTIPTPYRFKATDLIAPAALVAVGVAGLELKPLKRLNREVTDGLWHPGQRDLKFDNFTPYLPIAAT